MVMGMARMSLRYSAQMSPLSGRSFIELICEAIKTVIANTDAHSSLVTDRIFHRTGN